jgi:antitoxin component of MazEF toxin-antitoxin module
VLGRGFGRIAAIRRLTKNSGSRTIALPRPFRHALKLQPRDWLYLELQEGADHFTVRPAHVHPPADDSGPPRRGNLIAYRKLTAYGNSLSVPVPTPFQAALNLFVGDELHLMLSDDRQSFTVRPWHKHDVGPTTSSRASGVAEAKA